MIVKVGKTSDAEDNNIKSAYKLYHEALQRLKDSEYPAPSDECIVENYLKYMRDRKTKAMIYHAADIFETKGTYK